jgi:hypothetical protein
MTRPQDRTKEQARGDRTKREQADRHLSKHSMRLQLSIHLSHGNFLLLTACSVLLCRCQLGWGSHARRASEGCWRGEGGLLSLSPFPLPLLCVYATLFGASSLFSSG